MAPPRIASLVPSLTELLVALGLAPHLVARTGFCVHPASVVAGITKVGGTKDVHLARLRELAPTHVVVNVDENRLDTVAALREFVPHVIVTHPCAPLDNLALYRQMVEVFGELPGVAERAEALAKDLQSAWAALTGQAWAAEPVLYLIWRQPWMTVARDTYLSRMLAAVGWQTWPELDGGPTGAARYPVLQGQEPGLQAVTRVLLSSEPYAFGPAHVAEAQALCPRARVHCVDGELLSWYGPRAAQGLRYLQRLRQSADAGA